MVQISTEGTIRMPLDPLLPPPRLIANQKMLELQRYRLAHVHGVPVRATFLVNPCPPCLADAKKINRWR